MFFNHVAEHIRYVGKFLLAVEAAVGSGGVKVKFGFAVEGFSTAGAALGDANGE